MYLYRKALVLILFLLSINPASAITLTSGNSPITPHYEPSKTLTSSNSRIAKISENDIQPIIYNYSRVFVEGNLFLDYSVFNLNENLSIVGNVNVATDIKYFSFSSDYNIIGEQGVNILSYDQEPTMPDLSVTAIFQNPSSSMNEVGSTLIYSDIPITNGIFEATNNIYVGNYSSIKPVPLPPTLWLFLSGLAVIICKTPLNQINVVRL